MKLPIKKKYFDEIKAGKKRLEFRDAHITFVCEETGEKYRLEIESAYIHHKKCLPDELQKSDMFEDDRQIWFKLY